MSNSGNDEETDSFTDEEEIDPLLKYVRLTNEETENELQDILSKDALSCIAVHSKFFCLGTRSGGVHILDHLGNTITLNGKKSFQTHRVKVNQISVDSKGEFIATCSDDGMLIINGLYTTDNNLKMNTGQKVTAVALDPNFYKSPRKFIAGDKQLTMYERTLFKSLKSTVLSTSEGFVSKIAWNGQWVAWATDVDVRIYDLVERNTLDLIKWEVERKDGKLGDYRCHLKWSTPTTLIIGWLDTIRICSIRKPNAIEASTRNTPNYIVETKTTFRTEFYICGLAPLATNQVVVLGFPKERDPTTNMALRPLLSVFQYTLSHYNEICSDCLPISGYQDYNYNDYHLDCLIDENQYFIITPKDIIVASQCDRDDRVEWLIKHEKFDQAMEIVAIEGGKYSLISVEHKYIDYLLRNRHYEDAAKLCLRAFGNNKLLWEEEVYKFLKVQQLRSISAYIPRTIECKLNAHIYEMILYEYLQLEPKGFLELIKEWNPALYNTSAVIKATLDHVGVNVNNILLEALAILYSYEKKYENALTVYLKLQHKDVFNLIQKHNLYNVIQRLIAPLIKLDSDKAIQMLLETNKISPDAVVEELQQKPEYLYLYLDALKDKSDHSEKYHEELISLYAKFAPEKLLPFLRRSNTYRIQKALDICTRSLLYPEMVYLLGRMGSIREALAIIINKLNHIEMAIEFCKEHDDVELWNILIDKSVDKPEILTKVIFSIIGYINPEILINKIKMGQKIPELKKSLIKMLCDYDLQLTIQNGCNDLLATDYFNLHEKLIRNQRKGMCISNEISCELCRRDIIIKGSLKTDIVAFNCRHVFHETCLPDRFNTDYCVVCNSKKS